MIVPMKKVTLFFSAKHHDEALLRLRHLGVLHIQDIERRASDDIQQIETTLENIERILKLPELQQDTGQISEYDPGEIIQKILGLLQQKDSIQKNCTNSRSYQTGLNDGEIYPIHLFRH
jgi:vacuolar-type H+-ATPase subunit I/STV1